MKRPIQKIRGAILVMAALILVLLIGVAALALDLGRLFVLHTEMQNAVDAAALSAAVELDGEEGALGRAEMAANQDMLDHLSHFSKTDNQLLQGLPPSNFTFYSWIGSNQDPSVSPCGAVLPDRCITTDYADASYVQIELKPADANDGYYTIDLYFLPVLSLFGIIDIGETASTRVAALAGAHYEVCDYPPMIVCDPGDLDPGDMVVLKTHQGGSWEGGSFGWLAPNPDPVVKPDGEEDPIDVSDFNEKQLLAHRLGSRFGAACSPPIVEIKTGNLGNSAIRQGLNTRFGMYDDFFKDYEDFESLPSAPNVIDYPRDDQQTDDTKPDDCELADLHPPTSNGHWDVTECGTENGKSAPGKPLQQPSTYSRTAYNRVFLGVNGGGGFPGDLTNESARFDYYNYELGVPPTVPPTVHSIDDEDIHNDESQCVLSGSKYIGENGNQNSCRMLSSTPFTDVPVDTGDDYKRRELFVAVVPNCDDLGNVGEDGKFIDIAEVGGKWVKFFLTEHVDKPGGGEGLNVFAEFMEEVTERKGEHFRVVIQLYE